MTGEIDALALGEPRGGEVVAVQQHDAAIPRDATVAVVVAEDRRVELVVAAHRGEPEAPRTDRILGERVHGEVRAAVGRREVAGARAARQHEPARLAYAPVVVVEPGDDALDRVADPIVVGREQLPGRRALRAEYRAREVGDDRHLAAQFGRGGLEPSLGAVHRAHRILDRDELEPVVLRVALAAPEARQRVGLAPAVQMGAIQRGRDLYGQVAALERGGGRPAVG